MTKGWKLENVRHSLARKGIKTGRKTSAKVKWVRAEMGKMFKTTKGRKARGKEMKKIWREAKTKFG